MQEKQPRELATHVSQFIGHCDDQDLFFTKTIILKEDNQNALESRLNELMKYEDEKLVIFGIFSSIKTRKIIETFIQTAKHYFKSSKPIGRIWCAEINGTGKGTKLTILSRLSQLELVCNN